MARATVSSDALVEENARLRRLCRRESRGSSQVTVSLEGSFCGCFPLEFRVLDETRISYFLCLGLFLWPWPWLWLWLCLARCLVGYCATWTLPCALLSMLVCFSAALMETLLKLHDSFLSSTTCYKPASRHILGRVVPPRWCRGSLTVYPTGSVLNPGSGSLVLALSVCACCVRAQAGWWRHWRAIRLCPRRCKGRRGVGGQRMRCEMMTTGTTTTSRNP